MRSTRFPTDEDIKVNWRIPLKVLPYLSEFRNRVLLALACLVAAKIASVGLPFVLKYVVDSLNVDSSIEQILVVPLALIIAYGGLRLANVLFGEIRDMLFGRVTERAMRRIGLEVFQHLHNLDLNYHLDRQTGGLARDIERGSSGISFLMRFLVFNIGPTLIEILMVVGLLYYHYGYGFALIILFSVMSYVSFSVKATDWRTRFVKEMNQADSGTHSRAVDSLLNYETVKYFNNEAYEAKRYDENLATWERARRKNRLSLFALNGGQATIIALSMTSMMTLAAYRVASGDMTIGDFVLINAFTMQIFMPLNFLGFVYREIRGSLANIENLFTILYKQPQIIDQSDASSLKISKGQIRFSQVGFHYAADRPILNNIDFEIAAGQKVAVVGESGAGKSTLVKLLFRFYDPVHGMISIDGQDISQVSQQSLRQQIGIVPQDTVLFNDSIKENIRYGNPDATDEEVRNAMQLAHLSQFVDALPKGWETKVGERGLKLSGGEKQRVSIARTLLKRPPIMLFDEATSSLDSQSEQMILSALQQVAKGHTSLVIAHRLSTVIDADLILVLQQGKIVEKGTHQQLIERGGLYLKLWQAQQQTEH
jgi:ATP-binding cassette subfamily B protein